jgi:hypothetical protein
VRRPAGTPQEEDMFQSLVPGQRCTRSTYKQLVDEILTVSIGSAADGKIFKDISEAYDIGSKQSGDPAL